MKKIGVLVTHFEGFGRCFYNLFTEIDLVRRNCVMGDYQDLKMRSCPLPRKIIPHLIGQKMVKFHPSLRIVYFLFTKIDRANKKCAFRHIKKSGHFSPRPF